MTQRGPRNAGIVPEDPSRCVRFGPFQADFQSEELWKHGTRLKLAGQPILILEMLLARPGKLVSREELQKRLWPGGVFVDSNHGLNAAVNKLRDALCDTAEDPKYIETLPRRGYRFIGTVEAPKPEERVVQPVAASPPAFSAEIIAARAAPPPISGTNARFASMPWARAFAAFAALVILGIGVTTYRSGEPSANIATLAAPIRIEWDDARAQEQRKQTAERLGLNLSDASGTARAVPLIYRAAGTLRPTPTMRMVVSGNSGYAAPQFSPDEKRIAYMSNRSGSWEIWVSNADGSHPIQVSFTESAGTPRWSPDGRSIAFDAPSDGETRIFVARTDGSGFARPVTDGFVPSFSRDGKWVYFASERTGDWEVWKVPARGGVPVQVTTEGGFAALESGDGYLYYSKSRYPNPEICRVPVAGGEQSCGFEALRPRTWSSWAVTRAGIVFAEDQPNGQTSLSLYDTNRRQVRDLASLRSAPFWVGATADGKRAIVNDAAERQISMVENLQ